MFIGLGVVFYLMWKQLDIDQFKEIPWNSHTLFWLLLACLTYVIRHLFYSWRLKMMTDHFFNWWKSIELIFIWEFSSAVSPSSVGGSAVALFLLAQEKMSTAKTVSVVLYSIVLDTLFFLITIPILIFSVGPKILRPGLVDFSLDGYLYTLFGVYLFVFAYGLVFFYGLFISPEKIRRALFWISNVFFLKRFQKRLVKIGQDVVETSKSFKHKSFWYHFKCFIATSGAWFLRFLAVNFIIIALIPETPLDFIDQYIIYGRGELMHTLTQFSPTPGGAGVNEYMFGGFYSDYIQPGIAFVVALVWRLITYYPYLIIGAIIIPNWIRNIMNKRRELKIS